MIELLSLPISPAAPADAWRGVPSLVANGTNWSSVEATFDGQTFAGLQPLSLEQRLLNLKLTLGACRLDATWLLNQLSGDSAALTELLHYLKTRHCHELTVVADDLEMEDAEAAGRLLDGAAYRARPDGFHLSLDSHTDELFRWASSPNFYRVGRYTEQESRNPDLAAGGDPSEQGTRSVETETRFGHTSCPPRTRWLRVREEELPSLHLAAKCLAVPPIGFLVDAANA